MEMHVDHDDGRHNNMIIYYPLQIKIIIYVSASFEYLVCYGSTAIIICFNSFSVGTVFRRQNLNLLDVRNGRLWTSDSDV